ncbi:MAG: hypothetical protein Tsb0015_01370 [Simkaniaceae bacterium]
MNKKEAKDAIIAHVAEFWKFCGQRNYAHIEGMEPGIVIRYISGLQNPLSNGIFRPKSEYVEKIPEEIQFFQKKASAFTWWLEQEKHQKSLLQALQAHGFAKQGQYIGCALNLKNISEDGKKDPIEIIEVNDPQKFHIWLKLLSKEKAMTEMGEIFQQVSCIFDQEGPFRHFMAILGQNYLGIITLFISRGIPGIWNLIVLDQERKKEVERALVHKVLHEAKKLGFPMIVGFHPKGSHWMKSFGFETYCQFTALTFTF